MASLNTLRTKGGWFLTIIIAVALLAFIASDFGGRNKGKDPVVGTINGTKVRYTDFLNERDRQMQMVQGAGEDAQDEAGQRAWSELVSRTVLQPGFAKLGLSVSQEEQKDMLSGTGGGYISPVVQQYFMNPETGAFDAKLMGQFLQSASPEQYQMWLNIKNQVNDERLFSKYATLASNGVYINDLELNRAVDGENAVRDVRVVFKPYSLIADSTVQVSDGEMRKYYDAHKERFRRGASRNLEYVVFDIVPSANDKAEAKGRADELAAQFAEAADPAQFAQTNSDDKTPAQFVREDALSAPVLAAIAAGEMYGPVLEGENYVISRLAERRAVPDSVTFGALVLSADKAALADSLAGIANAGNFIALATQYSEETGAMAGGQSMAIDPAQMPPVLSDALLKAPVGSIARAENGGYIFLMNVVGKSAAINKVKLATVTLAVRAGAATHAEATNKARDFYTKASASKADFDKTATEMSLPKRVATVANTDRTIEGLENSRALIQWAFTSKQGAVREPDELSRDYIIVSTLTGVHEAGIAPFEEAKTQIRSLLVQRKKGDMLAETLTGASLSAVAQSQNLTISEAQGIKLSAFAVGELGFEPRLVGAICATKDTGKLSKPVRGTQGVYAFEVVNVASEENIDAAGMRVRMESMNQYMLNSVLMNALFEKSNVVDERVKYF